MRHLYSQSNKWGLSQELNHSRRSAYLFGKYLFGSKDWIELAWRYDDGGWSGAKITRPAFQQLLTDIEGRWIDVVVIYRIDRLSLAARLGSITPTSPYDRQVTQDQHNLLDFRPERSEQHVTS